MIKVMGSSALLAAILPLFLRWSRRQTEQQLDKMQQAAFNTPGAESPITPSMLMGALLLLLGHFAVGRLLGLRSSQRLLSLLVGSAGGAAAYLLTPPADMQ